MHWNNPEKCWLLYSIGRNLRREVEINKKLQKREEISLSEILVQRSTS